jgi:hypothetical protein
MRRRFAPAISWAAAAALLLAQFPAGAATAMSRSEYEACQARDEAGFRAAIAALTERSLKAGIAGLDYAAIVADAWRRDAVDDVIDREVDRSIGEVRDESSWLQLWESLASRDKAQELATTAAERVYRSQAMQKALEGVTTAIGVEVAKRIELAIVDTGAPTAQCLNAFLGPRYGQAIARIVADGAGKEFALDPAQGGAHISTTQVVLEGKQAMAGAVVLVARRQLSLMTSRIGQRIVGSILSRLVSVVAGGVGLVLIAKDIWDFRHGVLPIIAEEMKAKATKDRVREELAKSVGEQIGDGVRDISEKTADRVLDIWLEFRRAHAKVVELAEQEAPFRVFLDALRADDLPHADEIVALVLESEGRSGVLQRLGDGTLQRAVTSLDANARQIAREQRSLAAGLKWAAVAGGALPKVVDLGLYRRADPQNFTQAGLERLLALDDRTAIPRLAALSPGARETLFELPTGELKTLARALDDEQLASLARYLGALARPAGERILRAVAQTPARMRELARPGVEQAIFASNDQQAAVAVMLNASSLPDPVQLVAAAQLAVDGRVSPWLLWEKYPFTLLALGGLALFLLAMVKRLIFPGHGALPAERRPVGERRSRG